MYDKKIADAIANVLRRVEDSCAACGRSPGEITAVAVSKNQPLDALKAAYDCGLRHFGESRWQEASPKIEAMPSDVIWHFIGRLQSNKARRIGEAFQVIHSVDSESQIKELAKLSRPVDVLIEANLAQEPQKSGVSAQDALHLRDFLVELPVTHFQGLMTIGPVTDDLGLTRNLFGRLRVLNESLGGKWLSMGMSHDFDVAIQEGSTHVRIGTAIFGNR